MSFDTGPAGLLDISCDLGELVGRNLASPVGLYGLFDLTITACEYETYISDLINGNLLQGCSYQCEGNQEHLKQPYCEFLL